MAVEINGRMHRLLHLELLMPGFRDATRGQIQQAFEARDTVMLGTIIMEALDQVLQRDTDRRLEDKQ